MARMTDGTGFGGVLSAIRKEQGFPTAFAFFRKRGGQKGLGLSFNNYLNLERGKSLPKPFRLAALVDVLGLAPENPRARELVRSYLIGLLGSEDLLLYLAPRKEPVSPPQSWMLAETASRQAIGQRMVQLDLEQYQLLAREPAAYACHVFLANTAGWHEKRDLAEKLGLGAPAAGAALRRLAAAKLAELKGGRARSPFAGKFVTPPTPTKGMAPVFFGLEKHRQGWIRDRGRLLGAPYLLLRAPHERMRQYLPHLQDVVSMSALFGDVQPDADSAVFLVEGRVYQLF
jgi:hypothetical protein